MHCRFTVFQSVMEMEDRQYIHLCGWAWIYATGEEILLDWENHGCPKPEKSYNIIAVHRGSLVFLCDLQERGQRRKKESPLPLLMCWIMTFLHSAAVSGCIIPLPIVLFCPGEKVYDHQLNGQMLLMYARDVGGEHSSPEVGLDTVRFTRNTWDVRLLRPNGGEREDLFCLLFFFFCFLLCHFNVFFQCFISHI